MADQKAIYEIRLKDSFSGGLSQLDKGVDKFERNVKDSTENAGGSFSKLKDKIIGLGLAVGAGALIKNIAGLGIEMEQTRVSFTTFLGSAEKANQAIADLNQFSNVTPFDNAQVIKAGKGLLAFGTAQEDLIPTLKTIGDISAGTGKDFNELATIYGKARIAGTLYAEDINQLVEAGVPIMGEFAKALGTTEDQVKKMASEGKLKFSDLETAFQNLTGSGGMFFDLMQKQSETVGGRLSTIVGKLQTIGIAIGETLLPAIGYFADLALGILDNTEALKTFGIVVGIGAATWGAYTLAVNAAGIATKIYTGFQWLLNAALNANPIGLIVGGLAALTAGFVVAWRHSETFRGVILGLWESAKTVFNNLVTGFRKIPDIIMDALKGIPKAIADTFSGVGNLFSAIFTGDFSSIPGILKNLGTNILKSNPVSAVGMGLFEEFGKGAGEAFDKGFAKGKDKVDASPSTLAAASQGAAQRGATGQGSAKGKADKISSGISGSSPKNVTLNITKLIETINFNKQDMRQSTTEMTDMVKRALLTALNDVAIVQS